MGTLRLNRYSFGVPAFSVAMMLSQQKWNRSTSTRQHAMQI